jgi:hypothetical protein
MRVCLLLFPLILFAAEPGSFSVDLRNPVYTNGTLSTKNGGVVEGQDLRIQAKSIQYVRKDGVHKVEAAGDLLIQYKGRAYVGKELEYDFNKQSGVVFEGKTFSSIWYVGGSEVFLCPDGSYKVSDAFITTCENADSSWDLHAQQVQIFKEDLVEAKNVRFRLFRIPTFWLPSFKLNLKKMKGPVFRYSIDWDKGQGPRAMVRYQLYSWRDFALYGRVEYRWKTGWGGAIETEYFPTAYKTSFVTRSYLGTDRLETAPDKQRRYRLQGALHAASQSDKTTLALTWDKYSDVRMPADFKSEDFEVNTAKKTIFYLRHEEEKFLATAKVRPRVNTFESIKQDLPTFYLMPKPFELGKTGILSSNFIRASYLDFIYSNQLVSHLSGFSSARIEAYQNLSRAFPMGPLMFTPYLGARGIFYSKSPLEHEKFLGFLSYGARLSARAKKQWDHYKHQIEPYLDYQALSTPTTRPDGHYIFSIQDGYNRLSQFQAGVRNLLFSKKRPGKEPSFSSSLFVNAFMSEVTIPQFIPRLYLDLDWNLPAINISWRNAWNFRNHTLDYTNARFQWTVNENVAFSLEGRFRSRFDWRKADHTNFLLDVTRSESELLLSPLSDRRITFLTHLFLRLNPFWECHLQSHHGFYRLNETPYNEVKVDLFRWLSSHLKLRLSYSHTDLDDRFTAGISLVKK